MSYTKGEWIVEYQGSGHYMLVNESLNATKKEINSNIKLMENAPKLLEACIEAQSMMVWLAETDGDISPDEDEVNRILEQLNEAIYEAEIK